METLSKINLFLVQIVLTIYNVVNYKRRRVTKTALFTKILAGFEATNGEIKFASATFQLVEPPEIRVKLNREK